ncbi:hypothetical protein NIES4103_00640 [Nostoc sp. NIES-4103]|nr:hypothetical protein NIES4103_00640 [Nostoc sp. NIES-4103]
MTDSTKRHPVILFPGIAGSRLKTKNKNGEEAPLWFNKFQMALLSTNLSSTDISSTQENDISSTQEEDLAVSRAIVASYKTEADIQQDTNFTPVEAWRTHMKLQANGKKPEIEGENDEIFNREVEGLKGIKNVSNPREGFLPDEDMRYFHNLVERLKKEYSYTEDEDLIGHPYDWRVAPGGLEDRYQTFTNLKTKIENLYNHEDRHLAVVLIAHSMGNRVVQYFLKWVEANVSKAWIDQYIERYIAISPPWIGSPQAIYRLSDSAIVLPSGGTQIALKGMKDVLQSFSSIPWLLPVEGQYQYFNTEKNKEGEYIFGYVANSASRALADYQPITVQQTLEKANAQTTTLAHQTNFYQNDPLITETDKPIGSELVKCPPVQKLDVIYSTGFPTPVGAYYQETNSKLEIATTLGSDTPIPYLDKTGLVIKKGIILETPATTQQIEVEVADGAKQENSGDLVVPYGSLTYFKKWQKAEPNRHIVGHEFSAQPTSGGVQYPSVNHNAIVAHPDAITKIIQLLSESNA